MVTFLLTQCDTLSLNGLKHLDITLGTAALTVALFFFVPDLLGLSLDLPVSLECLGLGSFYLAHMVCQLVVQLLFLPIDALLTGPEQIGPTDGCNFTLLLNVSTVYKKTPVLSPCKIYRIVNVCPTFYLICFGSQIGTNTARSISIVNNGGCLCGRHASLFPTATKISESAHQAVR